MENAAMKHGWLFAGASGYSFKEWKGSFYPDSIKPDAMLAYYSQRLPSVEINSSFYGIPRVSVLENWARVTPDDFRFSIKAPKLISHDAKLKAAEAAEPLALFYQNLKSLGGKRGPVLFQLSPYQKRDVPRLKAFLQLLPEGHCAAFEFREASWFVDEVYDALRQAGAALCLSEREDQTPPPLVETASWGYLRLRLEQYSEAELEQWVKRVAETKWRETHVYFMHEPTAPGYAATLMRCSNSGV